MRSLTFCKERSSDLVKNELETWETTYAWSSSGEIMGPSFISEHPVPGGGHEGPPTT